MEAVKRSGKEGERTLVGWEGGRENPSYGSDTFAAGKGRVRMAGRGEGGRGGIEASPTFTHAAFPME